MLEAVKKIDQNAIILVSSAKEAYNSLRVKYYDRRLAVASSKLKELTNYEKKDEESIQDVWTRLSKLRSDIIAIKPSMKESYDDTELLMRAELDGKGSTTELPSQSMRHEMVG